MKEKEKIKILERIDLYIRGKLTQEEIDELWKTFLQHPEYYEWFETELHLRSLIRKGERPNFHRQTNDKFNTSQISSYKKWLYAAAAVVILAFSLQFFSMQQPEALSAYAIAEIEQSQLIGADVMRSESENTEEIDIAINDALATAYDGEADEAIREFEEILNQSPNQQQRARVEMNLGILLYNNGQYEPAKEYFQSVTEMDDLTEYQEEKSWWFLGNAYLNVNQPLEARDAVFNAYSLNGRYQSAALALLKKLDERIGNIPPDEAPARLGN